MFCWSSRPPEGSAHGRNRRYFWCSDLAIGLVPHVGQHPLIVAADSSRETPIWETGSFSPLPYTDPQCTTVGAIWNPAVLQPLHPGLPRCRTLQICRVCSRCRFREARGQTGPRADHCPETGIWEVDFATLGRKTPYPENCLRADVRVAPCATTLLFSAPGTLLFFHNEAMADRLPEPERATVPGLPDRGVVQIIDEQVARGERTLTPLGRKLLEARRRIEQSGIPLLADAELEREKAERRGVFQTSSRC